MYLLPLFAILLTGSLTMALYRRQLVNDTLQQQENEAAFYSRITNGLNAAPTQFPYQVGLRVFHHHAPTDNCGGSVISHIWILTAAHCTHGCLRVSVLLGSITRSVPRLRFEVSRFKIKEHKDFIEDTAIHDIAVIRTPSIEFSDYIGYVRLPPRQRIFPTYVGENAVLAGWGCTSNRTRVASPYLRYFTFHPISNTDCVGIYGTTIYESQLCTATPGRIGGCYGDSGGPLVLLNKNVQIGIQSYISDQGCESGEPDVYTRVSSYLDWIKKETNLDV